MAVVLVVLVLAMAGWAMVTAVEWTAKAEDGDLQTKWRLVVACDHF